MAKRIFSTIALWAMATLAIVYGGSYGFAALICALALGTNYEVCALLRTSALTPSLKYVQFATVVIFVLSTRACMGAECIVSDIAAVLLMLAPLWTIVKDPFGSRFSKTVLPTVAVIFIVPFMLKWFAVTANWGTGGGYENIMLAVWIIAAAKFSDVGAYVVGCAFGRHKMAPAISPNKTWEGALGGVLSSAAVGAVIAWIGAECGIFWSYITPLKAAAISMPIGAVAIMSDLLESVFKRRTNVKDSGAIIPGIGGMLDLADSLILCAPLSFVVLLFFALTHM